MIGVLFSKQHVPATIVPPIFSARSIYGQTSRKHYRPHFQPT